MLNELRISDTIARVIHLLTTASASKEPLLVSDAYECLLRIIRHCADMPTREEQIAFLFDMSCFDRKNVL